MSKNESISKDIILAKLHKHGIKVKYKQNSRTPSYLTCDAHKQIGLKLWGYIDYTGLVLRKPEKREFKKSWTSEKKKEAKPRLRNILHEFNWFNTREEANAFVNVVKAKRKNSSIQTEVNLTEYSDYRVTVVSTI